MRRKIFSTANFLIVAAAMILSFSFSSFAQEITGSIVGTVRDASGAVVPGATVTITDPGKNDIAVRTVTTNDNGEFSAPNLTVSVYRVTVEATNFKKAVRTEVKLDLGQRRTVDFTLEAGRIDEVVTVEAEPVAVDLQSAASGTVINGEQVRELSINNRNFVQLVTLAPGVTNDLSDQVYTGTTAVGFENGSTSTTAQASQPNTVQISVNGARSSQNTFTVDGADITDRGSNLTIQAYPSVDSIGEVRVLRSLYPAEAGRSGGGQVNVVTRSGGKRFSGSAFEFVRNEIFNANDYFGNQLAPVGLDSEGKAKRKPFRYNNFGWTLGGPIYFLRFGERDPGDSLFKKWDKTFFFFSQEFRRDRRSPTLFSQVPTAGLRQGVFTVPICLQATGTTCTSTLPAGTPLAAINSVARQYLDNVWNKIPLPNQAGFGLAFPTPNVANFRQEILKIDHSFSEKISGFYRFQKDTIPTIDANAIFSSGSGIPFVSTTETDSPGRTHTLQGTYVASSNLIFEGRYTFGYGAIKSKNVGLLALTNFPLSLSLPYTSTRDRVPTVSITGFNSLGSFGPYDNFSWKGNLGGNTTWITGSHTIKFGAIFSKYRKNENALAGVNEGQFSGFNTPGATASVIATGGNATQQNWANFLLGTNVTFTQARFDYTADLRQKTFEWFAQDEFRAFRNLTLYYGVRYSFFGSPYDANGRLSNFDPSLFNPALAPLVTGAGNRIVDATKNFCNGIIVNTQNYQGGPNNCNPIASPWGKFVVKSPKKDFAPRVGLAWDPFGDGKTAIRTGYGMYHEQILNGFFLQSIGINPPYQETCTITGTRFDQPVPIGQSCGVIAAVTAANIRAVEPNWRTPYTQHWSFDVQRQVTDKTLVTVGYYGSKGTNLIGAFEANALPPGYAISRGPTGCATGASTTPTVACQVAGTAFLSSAATNILDQIRPYRGYRSINIIKPMFKSNYHSLQVSAQHRFSGSSQVNFAYTFGKNLTDNQTDRSSAPQNSYDIRSDYGRAALDRRHVLTANFVYELPFLRKQEGLIGKVLGGWQASGIVAYQTGLPFTVTTSNFDASGLGNNPALVAGNRPTLLCDPNANANRTQQQYFNTACFALNPTVNSGINNVPGSSGRGVVQGPPTTRFDLTFSKNIRFGETMRVQLRAEAFNVFNMTNFRGLSTNVTAATFGQVTSVRDPRTMQFAIKFYF